MLSMKNKHVMRLTLFVSVTHNTAVYEILCRNKIFTGHIPSPVDFISDMQPLVDVHGLDFESCEIVLQTDAVTVNREYLQQIIKDPVQSHDRICILKTTYRELLDQALFSLPVPQHCVNFFNLYLNAIRYIHTIYETSEYSP